MYVSLNMDTDIVTNLINLFYYEILQFDRKCRTVVYFRNFASREIFTAGCQLFQL
jgi:hypothetical protein